MRPVKIISMLAAGVVLSGCAHSFVDTYEPVIDLKGVDLNNYTTDLNECRQYAVREDPANKAAEGAIAGAMAGALIGAAVGSAYGRMGSGAGIGASEGAAVGTVGGAATGIQAQQIIVKNCLAGRGYKILY